jgi:hypothetical protein
LVPTFTTTVRAKAITSCRTGSIMATKCLGGRDEYVEEETGTLCLVNLSHALHPANVR